MVSWGKIMPLILVGGVALSAWLLFREDRTKPPSLTPSQQSCMDEVAEFHKMILAANFARMDSEAKALDKVLALDPARMTAALEQKRHQERMQVIQEETAICTKIAACFPERPFKQQFDNCFSRAMEVREKENSSGPR